MHELSIACELVRVVKDSLTPEQLARVRRVNMRIGEATAVQQECLMFALEAVTKGTELENAQMNVERVKPLFRCAKCEAEFESQNWFLSKCPECGASGCSMLRGDELLVSSVDLE
jgi:hydrogenase nickel incorporation protein HypA/HybF